MKITSRRLAALATLTVLALTGCVRVNVDTTFGEDNTFSQFSVLTYEQSAADGAQEQFGVNLDDLIADAGNSESLAALQAEYPDQVRITNVDDGVNRGIELTIEDLPIDALADGGLTQAAGVGGALDVTREGDDYVVTFSLDTSRELEGVDNVASQLGLVESFIDFRVTYTFPGLVKEANAGEISGNTVTLSLRDLATNDEVRIVGGAKQQIDWGPYLRWGLVALGAALLILAVVLLVMQDRRRKRAHLPPPGPVEEGGLGTLQPPDVPTEDDSEQPGK